MDGMYTCVRGYGKYAAVLIIFSESFIFAHIYPLPSRIIDVFREERLTKGKEQKYIIFLYSVTPSIAKRSSEQLCQ